MHKCIYFLFQIEVNILKQYNTIEIWGDWHFDSDSGPAQIEVGR